MLFKHEMGSKVKEVVTGFEGIITGRTEYITGCRQYLVTSQECKAGKTAQSIWYDEDRLVVDVDVPRVHILPEADQQPASTGGPQAHPAPIK